MSDDLIKRSDALSAAGDMSYIAFEIRRKIRMIPSAEPKSGEWIDRGMRVPSSWVKKCSLCGHETDTWRWCKFCPNCGAKMSNASNASNTLETLEKGETE